MTFRELAIDDIFTIDTCNNVTRTHLFKKIQPIKIRNAFGFMTHTAICLASDSFGGTVIIENYAEVFRLDILIMTKDESGSLTILNKQGKHQL